MSKVTHDPTAHPKWCALPAHTSKRIHYSITVTAGAVSVALRQAGEQPPTVMVSLAGVPAASLTLDQAQALNAGLISLLVRTGAA